ncbi:MAG: hypothetical protein WBD36_12130 [Bacteroidota bacterium]
MTLNGIVRSADGLQEVKRTGLSRGDWLFVKTAGSLYRIRVLGKGRYQVTGGWFEKKGMSPAIVSIAGCTWGGSAIKVDIVAACGLRMEFGNRLVTSPVQKFFVLEYGRNN